MLTYALDARTATAHFPGIGRYVVNLARAMAPRLNPDEHLVLLRDPIQPSPWDLTALAEERVRVVDFPSPLSPPASSRLSPASWLARGPTFATSPNT